MKKPTTKQKMLLGLCAIIIASMWLFAPHKFFTLSFLIGIGVGYYLRGEFSGEASW